MSSHISIDVGSGINPLDKTAFTNYFFGWNDSSSQTFGKPNSVLDLIFVVDTTGSMGRKIDSKTRWEIVKDSLIDVLNYLVNLKDRFEPTFKTTLTIIKFSVTAQYVCNRIEVSEEGIIPIITTLNAIVPKGGTNLGSPYEKIKEVLSESHTKATLEGLEQDYFSFLMTDGKHNSLNKLHGGFSNEEVIEIYSPIKDKCVSLGIGDYTQYDKDILENVSSQLRSASTAEDMMDHIVGVSFGKCTTVAKDMVIKFPKLGAELITPTPTEEADEEYVIKFDTFDVSQRVYISYGSAVSQSIPFTVSYTHISNGEDRTDTINTVSNEDEDTDIYLSRHYYTLFSTDFLRIQNDPSRTDDFSKHRTEMESIHKKIKDVPESIKNINTMMKLLFTSLDCAVKSYTDLIPYVTNEHTVMDYKYSTPTILSTGIDISAGRMPSVQRAVSSGTRVPKSKSNTQKTKLRSPPSRNVSAMSAVSTATLDIEI